MPFRAPGQLGRDRPLALEHTRVLDEVPPHLVADQLVVEDRLAAGVAVALDVVDIERSHLLRLAGSEEFPDRLEAPPALGPEIVPEGLPSFYAQLQRRFPGCVAEPLWLRGRVTQLAGVLLPSYEVGGDWFDFVENRDGAWLAIADAADTGPTAAGLGAAALGALCAARRADHDLAEALAAMHETVRRLGNPEFFVTALVARWRAPTATLTWVNCGHPPAYVVDADGNLEELEGPAHPALGTGSSQPAFEVGERRLHSGERLILVTDGITERHLEGGGQCGVAGLRGALERGDNATAASTAMATQQAVTDCWCEPLEDDATVVVMCVA